MPERINRILYDIGYLDILAESNTILHRLDPRAKLLTTAVFVLSIVSFGKYEIVGLLPFFLYPALLIGLGNLPVAFLFRKLLTVSPFVIFIGIFNPWLDRDILMQIGSFNITGGWTSFVSLLLRFILTVGTALILIASTGFPAICMAMEKLGTPNIFAVQLLLLYRYLFILLGESLRMVRAHALRSFNHKNRISFRVFLHMLGNLLLRTIDRAQRIHMTMLSRAFSGEIRSIKKFRFGLNEFIFLTVFTGFFIILRFTEAIDFIGSIILGISL